MSHKFLCKILLVITLLQTVFVICEALNRRFLNDTIPPEELIRMMEGVKKSRYLLRNRSKNEWFALSRRDPIPENIWVPGGDIKLIIHGYTFKEWQTTEEKIGEQGIFDLGIAYSLKNASSNVIVLDWTILSTEPISRYFEAAQSTRFVGRDAAKFLVRLAKEGYITDWDRVHIIGFSLGGHTVGVVGHEVQELAGIKIGRITGLDPAGPLFDMKGEMPGDLTRFLDKGDGKFVDIIHCNMRVPPSPIVGFLGSCLQAGHIDFYPDGGESQSGCTKQQDRTGSPCSHFKCVEYMTKSIGDKFLACPCENWNTFKQGKCECSLQSGGVLMGDPCCGPSASGQYYIKMN